MPHTPTHNQPFSDFLSGILEDDPRLSFFSFANEQARTPAQKRFFQNQFNPVFNEFLGTLGTQLRGGTLPTTTFSDFLGQSPFVRRFAALPPSLRGDFSSQYLSPRTRSIFF